MTMAACEDSIDALACARPQAKRSHGVRLWAALRQWRQERATLRALEALPDGMRKDFGWPTPDRAASAPCSTITGRA